MRSKWNKKRIAGFLISLAAFAGALAWISNQEWPVTYYGIMGLFCITTSLVIFCLWRPYKLFTLILCVSLVASQANAAPTEGPHKDLTGACVIAVIILGIGVVIIVSLKKLCNKCLPPAQPPAQPPPPQTNAPPHLASLSGSGPQLSMNDDGLQVYDVSTNHLNNVDPNGYPYLFWFTGSIESSTNLSNWTTECTLNGWASATTVVTIWSNETHSVTNFSTRSSGSIQTAFPDLVADADRKFFRIR